MHSEDISRPRPRTSGPYSPAAERAGRMLCRVGLTGLTLPDGRGFAMFQPDGWAWLEELRVSIGSNDPREIGGAAILEAEGYERTQPALFALEEVCHA